MSWLAAADWADAMSEKLHQQRLRVAVKHFDLSLNEIWGNEQREKALLARYEASGLPWPPLLEEDAEE
ncbi:MAG TPA: hypothetical protein PKE64_22715 [Anaerolineae bacterium]|nr:hypothetical protein [Anaerolineae bacterium]HMR66833.1 hypothetical protein [Anaerolineae bacterium]